MSDIAFLPATDLSKLYRERELSPVEVTEAALRQIAKYNPRVNAYCLIDAEQALVHAGQSEERYRSGAPTPAASMPLRMARSEMAAAFRT
jgi:aspartyl-tRNA(Asn)/glutamyl-tRNA(Gln) amidotransferase subunit A